MIDWRTFSSVVRSSREEHNISQSKIVAEIRGISPSAYSRLELGHSVSTEVMLRVCRFFSIDPMRFLIDPEQRT